MKKTIKLSLKWHFVPLKLVGTLLLITIFSSVFGQINDPPGFDATKERQEGLRNGVHQEEIESYVEKMRRYYQHQEDIRKFGGTTQTTPTRTFERKSGGIDCFGDFENGTVPSWTGYTASNTGLNNFINNTVTFTTGVVSGRHTIMTTGNDPVVNAVNKVHLGNYSLRLGNNSSNAEAERVAKTITVTGTCLSFWYALIFEDPSHPSGQQPFFMFRILDNNGNVIHSYIREASTDPFFTALGGGSTVVYRDWTKYEVNLGCQYIGKDITIEFTNADCYQGAHYGYTYIDDVCMENCCNSCEKLFNNVGVMLNYNVISYKGSTDSSCCYKFNWIFDPDIFKCSPFGVRIYNDSNPSEVYTDYLDTLGLVWSCRGSVFDASVLDFCVNRSNFTKSKKLRIEFLDHNGDVICDTLTKIIEPCHSSSSGCNCNSLFDNQNFANTSIIKKDTAASDEYDCCFTIEPFRDSSIIKCPYYGMRVYKDTVGGIGHAYLDSFKTGTPIGGPGADMGDTNKMKFCIGAYVFSNNGPQKLRIEYLDSTGKVICSKTETVNCEQSCCENVNVFVRKDTTETDPFKCCYRIEVWAFACNKTFTAELMRETDSGWVNAGNDTFSISRPIFFDVCADNSDTARYMVFIKDSSGKVLCNKEVIQTCPNCCDIVAYTATYVPPPPHSVIDRCCWDINVYPAASEDCNVGYWGVYDSLHKVPSSYSPIFSPPSTIYQGRHCTPIIQAPNPAPGTSITIKYCIKRYLAVYDVTGKLLCIKPFELCCYRTYTNYNGNPQGPMSIGVVPNPFNEAFTMSMDLPQPMPVAVNVVNSSGTVVFERNYGQQPAGEFTTEINLAGLPPGNYTLSVNNGQATAQIVKQ